MTIRPGKFSRETETNGQPEGSAITSRTGKPGVACRDRKSSIAAGQNNSNPTLETASAVISEWELIVKIDSHYCFIYLSLNQNDPFYV